MRIGIDIDDTLVSTSQSFYRLVKKHNMEFNKRYNDFSTTWTKEERDYIFDKFLYEILTGARFKRGAKKAISEISKKHDLFIITARCNHYCDKIEDATNEFIEKNKLNIKKIYFGHDKKSGMAKRLNLDLMIDYSPSVYKNMKEANIDCILFGVRFKNWEEILKYIESKERKHGKNNNRRKNS